MTSELVRAIDEVSRAAAQDRNTFFQLNYFNLGKEPTVQGKLHCCLVELKGRRESLEALAAEIAEAADQAEVLALDLARVEARYPEEERAVRRRMAARKIGQAERHARRLEARKAEVEQEAEFFLTAYRQLAAKEAPRPWDDFHVQLEYWNAKFAQELRTRALAGSPVDLGVVRSIMQLPDAAPIKAEMLEAVREREKMLPAAKGDE